MGTRDTYVSLIKNAFVSTASRVIQAALIAEFPFLASPFLKQFLDLAVSWIVGKLGDSAEIGVFFLYIDMRTSQQGKDFSSAADAYRIAKEKGDPNEIAKAERAVEDSFRKLVKFSN